MNGWTSLAALAALFGASAWAGYAWTAPAAPAAPPPPGGRIGPAAPAPKDAGKAEPAPAPPTAAGDLDGGGPGAAAAKPDEEPVRLAFTDLTEWDLDPKDVQVPKSILELGGKRVDLVGYMIPYGDPDRVEEFLLVRDLGSCCFGLTPQPHHIVECRMAAGKVASYLPGPVRVRGKFRVEEHRQGDYLISVYAMTVDDFAGVR